MISVVESTAPMDTTGCAPNASVGIMTITGPFEAPMPPDHIMQFFAYEHLPPKLQAVSKPFCDLARMIVASVEAPAGTSTEFPLPRNPERTKALNHLLEAKDCAVRAAIAK